MTQFTAALASPATEDAVYVEQGYGESVGPVSVTIVAPFNLMKEGDILRKRPPFIRKTFSVLSVNGSTFTVDQLSEHTSRADGWLDGATVTAFRMIGSDWVEVGSDAIASSAGGTHGSILGGGHYFTATEGRWTLPGWHRPSFNQRLWVAAIDANGDRSPWAGPVTWTTPANPTPQSVANTTNNSISITGVENGSLATPTGLAVADEDGGQTCHLTWNASAGASGYIVFYTDNDTPPSADANNLTLAGSLSLQPNDLVTISKEFPPTTTKEDVIFSRVWNAGGQGAFGASYRGPIWPEDNPGVTWEWQTENDIPHFRVTNASGSDFEIARYTHGGSQQAWYDVPLSGVNYRQTLEIKADAAATMNVEMYDFDNEIETVNVTTGWQELSTDHAVANIWNDASPRVSRIFIPNGRTVDIRSWYSYDSRYTPLAWKPDELALLPAGTVVRMHSTIKTNPWSYDLERLTDPGYLPALLARIKEANCLPWFQIEWHFTEAEWLGLAEYLCTTYSPGTDTPASKPWAYKRYQQGQQTPWADEFSELYLELGNENWNYIDAFYTMPSVSGQSSAVACAKVTDWAIETLRSHPDWVDSKWTYPLGGHPGNMFDGGFTDLLAQHSEHGDFIMVSNYNGGWDTGQNSVYDPAVPDHWRRIAGGTDIAGRADTADWLADCADSNGKVAGSYEAGPGYVVNGLNGGTVTDEDEEVQSAMMKSCASWTGTWTQFLVNAARGWGHQNFFLFGAGVYFNSHSKPDRGGKANAPFMVQQFWQEHLYASDGSAAVVELTKVKDQSSPNPNGGTIDAMRVWKVTNGSKIFLIVANQDIDASHDIQILSSNLAGKACIRHYLDTPNATPGEEYKAHNTTWDTKDDVILSSEALLGNTAPLVATIPPGMTEIYEFV